MAQQLAVRIVAGDPLSRAGVIAELKERTEFALVDDDGGEAAVAVVVADTVDDEVVRMVRMLRCNGCPKVCLIVGHIDDQGLFRAVEAGITGIVRRSEAEPARVAEAVHAAAVGNGSVPPDLLGRLLGQLGRVKDAGGDGVHLSRLSEREAAVLRLVAEGLDTAEIAHRLAYSERTIKNIIQSVTTRLNLRNRSHAVAYVLRHGLI